MQKNAQLILLPLLKKECSKNIAHFFKILRFPQKQEITINFLNETHKNFYIGTGRQHLYRYGSDR